jgi:hypothetical protein
MTFARMLTVAALVLMLGCRKEAPVTASSSTSGAEPSPATDTTLTGTVASVPPDPCNQTVTAGGVVQMPPIVISGNIPVTVPLPQTVNSPLQVRPNFDWFSWEEFIALNWPASSEGRGNPQNPNDVATFKSAANGTPTVWGTYKANWELFSQGSQRPTPFDSWVVPVPAACAVQPGQKALVMTSKTTVLNDGLEAFSYPLVDAQQNYLMYEVRYGRAAYDFMRGPDDNSSQWLYLAKNLTPPTQQTMPSSSENPNVPGAIMTKASWRLMSEVPQEQWNRYYVVNAQVFDATTGQCNAQPVGLVGLHIAQKVSGLPEWVWSTFEQVDVLTTTSQPGLLAPCQPGDTNCSQVQGFANRPASTTLIPDKSKRVPANVARINPIPTTPTGAGTDAVNAAFQQALAGTVWANYQLIVTQWPFNPGTFKAPDNGGTYPCWSGDPFPTAQAVNLTMETYFQNAQDTLFTATSGGNGCMGCHFGAALYDYSWGLKRRPHA